MQKAGNLIGFFTVSSGEFQNGTNLFFYQFTAYKDIIKVFGDCWSFHTEQFGYSILSKPHRFIFNTHFHTGLAAAALVADDFILWLLLFMPEKIFPCFYCLYPESRIMSIPIER
ncbi:MAG: hypothetical protein WCI23_04925 [Chlorobiaceae bacterium]